MAVDQLDLNGTVAAISVSRVKKGILPPFNSLDYNFLTMKSPKTLQSIIGDLKQGLKYFFLYISNK